MEKQPRHWAAALTANLFFFFEPFGVGHLCPDSSYGVGHLWPESSCIIVFSFKIDVLPIIWPMESTMVGLEEANHKTLPLVLQTMVI